MYFNLSRYMCRFVFFAITGSVRMVTSLAFLPVKISYKLLALTCGGLAFAAVNPARKAIQNKFFPPVPPKRYMKVGKPAVAPITASAVNRPSLGDVAPVMYAYRNVASVDAAMDHMKRSLIQKQIFRAKFADVVQVGA
ncbi:MAG: hypothetical protein EYC62_01555 [Alphaproteobacteria bacterium]|nr:MAG: hypothetical protein EYC62_01555 [Alphaproteobacteria bacterium]